MKIMEESKGMKRMCKSLLFVFGCVVLTVRSQTGQILPPRNVSLSWMSEFKPTFSWAPPEDFGEGCNYSVPSGKLQRNETYTSGNYWIGRDLDFSVQTVCNDRRSEPAVLRITYPELVKDVKCSYHTNRLTNCSWTPASHVPDLQLIYQLLDQSPGTKNNYIFEECSAYDFKDDVKTGCRLQNNTGQHFIYMSFTGRLNNTSVKNTFKIHSDESVYPPALNWTVVKAENKLIISWTPPDIFKPSFWNYTLKYTKCGDKKSENEHKKGGTSMTLEYSSHCAYNMSIQATKRYGETKTKTPWSKEIYLAADVREEVPLIYAAIIIPLMFSVLAALTFVCIRKHKEKIFPKVPEPRDLLRDIFDSNNDTNTVGQLYVPAQEEECKITLVVDPPNTPKETSDPSMH
ncbi:interleukin-13 receptor subunit alpha-1-like [Centroberyx affinis]|uniref:interleukin-13 receptor subunit alpha-1-like n=1 Tax=Centroberyx affinis TaxID=166261 RepID=UPI003A5C6107